MDGRRLGRWATDLAVGVMLATLMFAGRPYSLGGRSGYVMVRGTSMTPTYRPGDMVLTRAGHDYRVGDIVAYRVPHGDFGAGILVIHRITGGTAGEGYTLQGDNNPQPDRWHPKPGDIVGKAWLHIPHAGGLLGALRAPLPLASLAAGIVLAVLLVPADRRKSSRR